MQTVAKISGRDNNTSKYGDSSAMPDFFMSFLASLTAQNSGNLIVNSQALETNVQNSEIIDDNQNQNQSGDKSKSDITPIDLVALPIGFFNNVIFATNAPNSETDLGARLETSEISAAANPAAPVILPQAEKAEINANQPTDAYTATELDVSETENSIAPSKLEIENQTEKLPETLATIGSNEAVASKTPPHLMEAQNTRQISKADFAENNQIDNASNDNSSPSIKTELVLDTPKQNALHQNNAKSDKPTVELKPLHTNSNSILNFNNSLNQLQAKDEIASKTENKGEIVASKIHEVAQIMVEKAQSGERTFFVRLDPPELGKIEIELKFGANNKIDAVINAQTPEALGELMRQARDMVDMLNQAGFDLSKNNLNFNLNNSNNGNQNRFEQNQKSVNGNDISDVKTENTAKQIITQKWNRGGISLIA